MNYETYKDIKEEAKILYDLQKKKEALTEQETEYKDKIYGPIAYIYSSKEIKE